MIMMAFQNNGEKMVYSENNRIGSFLHTLQSNKILGKLKDLSIKIKIYSY